MGEVVKIGEIVFESVTTGKTIPVSDDYFALVSAINKLVIAIERMAK